MDPTSIFRTSFSRRSQPSPTWLELLPQRGKAVDLWLIVYYLFPGPSSAARPLQLWRLENRSESPYFCQNLYRNGLNGMKYMEMPPLNMSFVKDSGGADDAAEGQKVPDDLPKKKAGAK